MPIETPYPDLDELMFLMGEAGRRLSEIEASEGAAGNISVYMGWEIDPRRKLPNLEVIPLPDPLPELVGACFLVSGSGRRLREIIQDPGANVGFVRINPDGRTANLYSSSRRLFAKVTSEFNSHLAVHRDQIISTGTNFHAVVHAQPLHLTYLSHIQHYQDEKVLNQSILRWQPETIVNLPEGLGLLPFLLPGSPELMSATVEKLRTHRVVVWSKHGVMSRSDNSVKRAGDRIEYAETGARYEYLNLLNQGRGQGLTPEEVRAICSAFGVQQSIF